MPIRLLGLKAVQRTKLSQRLAAASAASLALGRFSLSQGLSAGCVSCRGVRNQPGEAQQPSSPGQPSSDQTGERHLHPADEQGSTCLIPKSQSGGPGDTVCMWPCFWDLREVQDELSHRPAPGCCPHGQASCGEATPAPCCTFWQAALSKARPPISAKLPSLCASLWLTPSSLCPPELHGG